MIQADGARAKQGIGGIATDVGYRQIHASIAVEVSRRYPLPPSGPARQAHRCGHVAELATLIAEETHRLPFDRQGQVEVTVAIEVHQCGSVHTTRAGHRTTPGRGSLQYPAFIHPHRGRDRLGIAPQPKLPAHHYVQVGIAVHVAHSQRAVEVRANLYGAWRCTRGRWVHEQLPDGFAPGIEVHGRSQPVPASEAIGPGRHATLASRGFGALGARKPLSLQVLENDGSTAAAGPMDEVLPTVAIEVGPCQPGALSAHAVRNERLDERVVEGFPARCRPQESADVFEERRGQCRSNRRRR